jgi:hypothetical protein
MARSSRGKNKREGAVVTEGADLQETALSVVEVLVLPGETEPENSTLAGVNGIALDVEGAGIADVSGADEVLTVTGAAASTMDVIDELFGREIVANDAEPEEPEPEILPEAVYVLRGFIDEATRRRVTGWVWDPERPDTRVELSVFDGEREVAKVVANQYRADLREAGIGDGRHAFNVPLERSLVPQPRHELHLRCIATGGEVPGSPIILEDDDYAFADADTASVGLAEAASPYFASNDSWEEAAAPPEAEAHIPTVPSAQAGIAPAAGIEISRLAALTTYQSTLQSNVDFADWTGVRGWVWDPQQPDRRVALELLDGDNLTADRSRRRVPLRP